MNKKTPDERIGFLYSFTLQTKASLVLVEIAAK